ncbi:CCAAT/enhancer-binding protein zeta [Planococcus citri]|uniref:CCAAT/enhancer-binding protein zeta n=1 Tax=Planococcus citri TaxID=170843 RepID=UPI0031F8066D
MKNTLLEHLKLPKVPCDPDVVESLRQEAELVLEEETQKYKSFLLESKKSETKWMITMAKSGTSSDKVAALALMVQESPVFNLSSLSSLVNMAKVSKKHQFNVVLETLTELFVSELLHPSKKLRKFSKQPLAHLAEICPDNATRREKLCNWLYEDKLKTLYEQYIKLLNDATHDSVQANREKAVGAMLKLLQCNREQENVLISNLINKFGDPVHKVASRVVYGLEKVISNYPKKKPDILDEVERMLFRPHISKRAQYYGVCFLSQFKLSGTDKELSRRLIILYFSFFKACVKTGDIDSRLMGALLVGVNRAYPYASRGKSNEPIIPDEHVDTMYKVVHLAPFKIGLQALALLLQISNTDRFYNALYKKLFDKELIQTSHQAIWLNLMMKAIRKDTNNNRRKSFVKRILQVCLYFPVPLICGILVIVSQLVKNIEDVRGNFKFLNEQEELELKEESQEDDILSNLKRFDDDDEDERYDDVKTEEELAEEAANPTPKSPAQPSVPSSWYHRTISAPKIETPVVEKKYQDPVAYDPLHRNPAYAGGEKAVFVELYALSQHFHPTVSLFAKKVIKGERINYTGDPLKDFTLVHFLERFSYKNPKKSKFDRGEEKEELFRAVGSQRKHYNPTGMKALSVKSDEYLNQTESAIPVDELFLYKYLKDQRAKKAEESSSSEDELELDSDEKENDDFSSEEDEDSDKEPEHYNEEYEESEQGSISDFEKDENDVEDDDDEDIDLGLDEDADDDDNELDLASALKKRITRDFGSMAVPAEQFSEMLEEAGKAKSGGSHDIFNRDNASEKQLKWESKRMNKRMPKQKGNFRKRRRN